MQLKCSRYIFNYKSHPSVVEDFILRADDLASQTYGRDKQFSRLNQVLEQARFLGWPLPRFGSELPEELTEIPPSGIDHIFENQAKLLVDVAPATRVMLEDGRYCPVKMICGTTAAGDLVWRCHLLLDKDGTPYVQKNRKRHRVKIKGTKIACQTETLPYDDKYIFECYGGEDGVWPVPFLPEFFSDRPIAQKFSPESGVVEVVYIQEETPVKVLAHEVVPWYRPLEIDTTKALTMDEEIDEDVSVLVSGWDELRDNQEVSLDEDGAIDDSVIDEESERDTDSDDSAVELTNIITGMNPLEAKKLADYERVLSGGRITSKQEADELRKDPEHKDRAEKWLLAAINRLRLLSNYSAKVGALVTLVNKHPGQQLLILQPRQKWAAKLVEVLNEKNIAAQLFDPEKPKKYIDRFVGGQIQILVAAEAVEHLFLDDIIVISVSSHETPIWLQWLLPTQVVYTIVTKELQYTDFNWIAENSAVTIKNEDYLGPTYDILKLANEVEKPEPEPKLKVEVEKVVPVVAGLEIAVAGEIPKEPKVEKPKYKVKLVGKGRPKVVATYEKAMEMVQKMETEGKKCEVYGPEGPEALYVSGIGELDK